MFYLTSWKVSFFSYFHLFSPFFSPPLCKLGCLFINLNKPPSLPNSFELHQYGFFRAERWRPPLCLHTSHYRCLGFFCIHRIARFSPSLSHLKHNEEKKNWPFCNKPVKKGFLSFFLVSGIVNPVESGAKDPVINLQNHPPEGPWLTSLRNPGTVTLFIK